MAWPGVGDGPGLFSVYPRGMTDAKKRKLSEILGRKRARKRVLIVLEERDEVGEYVVEIETRAKEPTRALRVSRGVMEMFGPLVGRLLVGGGVELRGFGQLQGPELVKALADSPALWDMLGDAIEAVVKDMDPDDLVELAVRVCAGSTRFRVMRDPDARDPGPDGGWSEWVEIEDDDAAAEVLDDLIPSFMHLIQLVRAAFMVNARPISPGGRTSGESSGA